MALLRNLLAKQKADREEAERKRDALLQKRRGYAKATRDRELARRNGLSDLPPLIAVAIEEALETPAPGTAKSAEVATVEDLVARLTAARERLFWLQAVWATTLSDDV